MEYNLTDCVIKSVLTWQKVTPEIIMHGRRKLLPHINPVASPTHSHMHPERQQKWQGISWKRVLETSGGTMSYPTISHVIMGLTVLFIQFSYTWLIYSRIDHINGRPTVLYSLILLASMVISLSLLFDGWRTATSLSQESVFISAFVVSLYTLTTTRCKLYADIKKIRYILCFTVISLI